MKRLSWEEYALELAIIASRRSEDPYEQVGSCVLRHAHSVAGLGYNGAPKDVNIDWSNRDQRRARVIHAEVNALRYARPGECYLLACNLLPCNDCLKLAAAYGVEKIIFKKFYDRDDSSLSIAKEFGLDLHHYGD